MFRMNFWLGFIAGAIGSACAFLALAAFAFGDDSGDQIE